MRYSFFFFGLVLLSGLANAQSPGRTVSGRVTGQTGDGLPGVNILIKGTQKGTTTNASGQYALNDVPGGATLTFSSIGFLAQDVVVGNRSTVDVSLSPDERSLLEVVVVGYGTQRKIETTGAIASVKAADIVQTPVSNVAQGLQARVAGVQVTQNSSAPGGNISVRIRGTNSINGSSEPLYVIDGIQIGNGGGVNDISPLSSINPNDIESVEVLKDASSAAIYGARAANGVVLITTKRGKAGNTRVSYEGYYGTQRVNKTMPVLNATQFALVENETFKTPIFADPNNPGPNTDWQSLIFRDAPIQNHQLTVSGGNEKTTFSLSGNYFNQDGIVINSNFKRYSFRLNFDHRVSNLLSVGTSLLTAYQVSDRIQTGNNSIDGPAFTASVLGAAIAAPPTLVPYREDGSIWPFGDQFNGRYRESRNPLGLAAIMDKTQLRRTLGNIYAELRPVKGLSYRASLNVDMGTTLGDYYSPRSIINAADLVSGGGEARKGNSYGLLLLHESILTYTRTFANAHTLKFTGLFATQKSMNSANNITATLFPNDATTDEAVQLATNRTVSSSRSESRLDSYMGRINYGFKDKLFIDVTARYDGASKFGENHKYGFFPAASVAYRLIEEPFLKGQNFISDLKLRASYGATGNADAIGAYQSLALVGSGFTNDYIFNHVYTTGIAPTGIPNPDLRWEKSIQSNIGLDAGFWNNRLNLTVDVYNKRTNDLLFVQNLPLSSGYGTITGNFASLENKGVELALGGRILDGPVKWNLNLNATFNRNKLLSLSSGAEEYTVNNFSILRVGEPLGLFRTYIFDGNYQNGESVLPGSASRVGGTKVRDVNGDDSITTADQVITGRAQPNYIFGISTDVRYKNFDLSAFASGVQGNQVYNLIRYTFENPGGGRNLYAGVADRWTPTNPNNEYAGVLQGGRLPISDRFMEDGSFVRLKNVTIGYTLPKIKGLYSARIYVSGNNLLTLTNYTGYDPEVNTYGNSNTVLGVDNLVYPVAKSWLGGVQVTF
jgi:TonB-linked SusC/RagA family outer membrane protein